MMTTRTPNELRFVFFGTSEIAVAVLDALEAAEYLPLLIVTAPDRPQGRGLVLTPSPVSAWANARGIKTAKPERIDDTFLSELRSANVELFIVADYGKILPETLLSIPPLGTLNMHPSLLPRLRGPSPMRSAILTDERTVGVTIMLIDDKMDHGPILAQRVVTLPSWPIGARELETILPREGGRLLAEILPQWVSGSITPHEQDHTLATYTKRFTKEDGLLNLGADPYQNLLRIKALEGWPGTYAYFIRGNERIRVGILSAHLSNGALVIDVVKPEGRGEMPYEDFMRSGAVPAHS